MTRIALIGRLLVATQFALIGWLVWPLSAQHWSSRAFALLGGSILLGSWTLLHNRPGNFNIRPEPKASARLITDGPYRYARHPMYTAVLLFGAAEVVAYADAWKIAAWIALALVLYSKAGLEERGLRVQFPGYAGYCTRVSRFIPYLF